MCNYIDEFQWFVRADDDVYIRVEKLRKFLEHIDGDKMVKDLVSALLFVTNKVACP